jgi:hypothetical protein
MTEPKKPNAELKNLVIVEGSAVNDGDNPPAKIAMLKNKPEDTKSEGLFTRLKKWASTNVIKEGYGMPRTVGQIMAMDQFRDQFWKLRMAFVESMNSILECSSDPEQMNSMMAQSVSEFQAKCSELAKPLGATKMKELSDILASMKAATETTKARPQFLSAMEQLEDFDFSPSADAAQPADEPTTNKEKEQVMSEQKKEPAGIDAIMGKLSPDEVKVLESHFSKAAPEAPKEDPALKGASPELLKRMADMESELSLMKKGRLETEFTAKARALNVPGVEVQELSKRLEDAFKSGGVEGLASLEKMLSAVAAQARKGAILMERIGSAGKRDSAVGSADALVKQKAAELQKSNPKLTDAQAYAKVMADPANKALAAAAIRNEIAN